MAESKTNTPEKWVCKECGKEYQMKGNASKHAKKTNHLDFEKEY